MFAFFANSRYRPCPECGASLAGEAREAHECDRKRWLEFQMFRLRSDVARFEDELGDYLSSPEGRFELWYAEHRRAA